ncbi:hypothetical protein ACR9YC_07830 [Parasphingorhabdus sp. DH2-15]|uniref:hypothetical protein n=1 Tax=Parasphingorhabdus sp. DH2-15 TaxID=3444112 RepID=UPI003F684E1F
MTLLTTSLVALWLALPGIFIALRHRHDIAYVTACAAASIVSMLLLAAIIAMLIPGGIGAWFPLLATAFVIAVVIYRGKGQKIMLPHWEWQAFLPAICAISLSAYVFHIGFAPQDDGSLAVHSWYNADWFKHLGHVNAVTNLGLPAKDIFGGGNDLNYYWLFYMLPGTVAAIDGDPFAALYWSNTIVTAIFWTLLYGLVRKSGASPWRAGILGSLAIILFAFSGTLKWFTTGVSMAKYIAVIQPDGPILISMGLYIPQHTLMASVLMAWAIICYLPGRQSYSAAHILALSALAAAGALSTLFGALCLIIYGILQLLSLRRDSWQKTVAETALVGIASIAIIFWLSILDPGFGGNSIASPVFVEPASEDPYWYRFIDSFVRIVTIFGPALILGIAMINRWAKSTKSVLDDRLLIFAIILTIIGLLACILPEAFMDNLRLGREIRLRATFLPAIGATIALGWMVGNNNDAQIKPATAASFILICTLCALPSAYMRAMWHGGKGPIWLTHIAADDMAVLEHLSKVSAKDAMIWQYPEPPELAGGGDDTWVPIIAGRTIPASLRTTDYTNAVDKIAAAQRFFDGENQSIPVNIDWIYLSRHLHAHSFEALQTRLANDDQWRENYCLKDACLFARASVKVTQ